MSGWLVRRVLIVSLFLPSLAAAFNPADVQRLESGANDLARADLSGLNVLNRRNLQGVDFTAANFRDARLWSYEFDRAKLEGANLENASFHGSHFDMAVLKGATVRNTDLSNAVCGAADFTQADLSRARLVEAILIRGNLKGAKLAGADLTRANLTHADLTGADLSGAVFQEANGDGAKIDIRWQAALQSQNMRNFDKIQWVHPAAVKPADLARPGAGKVDKEPLQPTVPVKK